MALEIKQQLKLSQQLIMTPQLQQAIKLLQLSRLELHGKRWHQEIEAIQFLEDAVSEELDYSTSDRVAEEPVPVTESPQEEVRHSERHSSEMELGQLLERVQQSPHEGGSEDRELPAFENI